MTENLPLPIGRCRAHHVSARSRCRHQEPGRYACPPGWFPATNWAPNTILYEWGAIVGPLLLRQGMKYGISQVYMEFANVASPGDTVAVPTVSRDEGIGYYNDLGVSPDLDYLRIPVLAGVLNISDAAKYPLGNVVTIFAQSSGLVGAHGKPFSDTNNSIVYGVALVAAIDEADATRDRILSRFYYPANQQQPKTASSQIGIEYDLTLN